jgi:predicted metal-binding membrane protein
MQLALSPLPRPGRPDLMLIWGSVIGAWLMTLALVATGGDYLVGHDGVLGDRPFGWGATLLLFVASWQLMTAAMMLPSSMPMMAMYLRVARNHANPRLLFGVFMLGYFVVWTGFAAAALGMDAGVHWLDGRVPAVTENPSFLAGAILILAGTFQFSSLKEHCLDTCRDPLAFFLKGYAPGAGAAWNLGLRHGLFCLGCCWALMLTMFAIGMGSMVWMTALAGVMVIEKSAGYGKRLAHPIGIALVAWGVLVILDPGWIPDVIGATQR